MNINNKQNIVRRIPYASLCFTLMAILVHLFYKWRLDLLYERNAISGLELWRLATCHWVHLNSDHLFWSTATFLFLGSICEILDRKKTLITLGIAVVLIPLGLWWGHSALMVYCGLSGLDCALYALLFSVLFRREWTSPDRGWMLFYLFGLVALLVKVSYESITGQTLFVANTHPGMVPVPLSHLVGGLVGIMVGLSGNKGGGRISSCSSLLRQYNGI